jgi:hypothetical protein
MDGFEDELYPADGECIEIPDDNTYEVSRTGFIVMTRDDFDYESYDVEYGLEHDLGEDAPEFAIIYVPDYDGYWLPFAIPVAAAMELKDYDLVSVQGAWLFRRGGWYLFARFLEKVYYPSGEKRIFKTPNIPPNPHCGYCGRSIGRPNSYYDWGFDSEGGMECDVCADWRQGRDPREFIHLCKKVADFHKL